MNDFVANDELQHYGVKGMKWGVHRARKKLASATTSEEREKAVNSLKKHRAKGSTEINKLREKNDKLQAKSDKRAKKQDIKAANLASKAATKMSKANKWYRSEAKAERLKLEAADLQIKVDKISTKSNEIRAKIKKNETMQKAFREQINLIDETLVKYGKRYLNKS